MKYLTHQHDLGNGETLEIQLRYRRDTGTSWYSGQQLRRGLVLDFTPVEIKDCGNGFISKTYSVGDKRGQMFFLEEWKRQSDKKGREVAAFIETRLEELAIAGAAQDWDKVVRIMRAYYA